MSDCLNALHLKQNSMTKSRKCFHFKKAASSQFLQSEEALSLPRLTISNLTGTSESEVRSLQPQCFIWTHLTTPEWMTVLHPCYLPEFHISKHTAYNSWPPDLVSQCREQRQEETDRGTQQTCNKASGGRSDTHTIIISSKGYTFQGSWNFTLRRTALCLHMYASQH